MHAIAPMIVGFVALTAVSVQAALSPNQENWGLRGRPLSFTLGAQACGEGWHQALWRDWRGGGGVRASLIDDLGPPLFKRLGGLGP